MELGSAVYKISFLYTALYAVPAIYFLCYKISSGIVIREKDYFLQSRVEVSSHIDVNKEACILNKGGEAHEADGGPLALTTSCIPHQA